MFFHLWQILNDLCWIHHVLSNEMIKPIDNWANHQGDVDSYADEPGLEAWCSKFSEILQGRLDRGGLKIVEIHMYIYIILCMTIKYYQHQYTNILHYFAVMNNHANEYVFFLMLFWMWTEGDSMVELPHLCQNMSWCSCWWPNWWIIGLKNTQNFDGLFERYPLVN